MINKFFVIVFCLIVFPLAVYSSESKDDIFEQKKELEKIQKQVNQGMKKIDSLKSESLSTQKKIVGYDEKIATNKKVINRLNKQLRQLKNDASLAQNELDNNEINLERSRRRYLGNIRQFYFATHQSKSTVDNLLNSEIELKRQIKYLAALSGFESGNVEQAEQFLEESVDNLEDLTGQTKKVKGLKQKKETSTSLERSKKVKQEKTLNKLRRLEMDETERIMMLKQAAEEMENIIVRLERAREQAKEAERRAGRIESPSVFATLKGQILSPMRGKVIESYGNQVDRITKLKSFSPGIKISGKPFRKIIAVSSGVVAYVGSLRGYGKFVIINHDNQYYTTCAGLGKITVSEGQYLLSGDKIGDVGEDGILKFELRKGREPLDPIKWIKFDSF